MEGTYNIKYNISFSPFFINTILYIYICIYNDKEILIPY